MEAQRSVLVQHELFHQGGRRWIFFGRDPGLKNNLIDTNEYLVEHNGKAMLLDPGGMEIFPAVISAISRHISLKNVESIFASHQDPDVVSSLSMWLAVCPEIKVYCSWVWGGFIPHFGNGRAIHPVPDEGMTLPLGGSNDLVLIPAHYMHSSGNFSLYDPQAKILFSGDIGAALLPKEKTSPYVEDFESHIQYMEGFHKRWLPSNRAKNAWIKRVRALNVNLLCPQHGAIFRAKDIPKFLDWLESLEVGAAV